MVDERVADGAAATRHDVEMPRGQAALVEQNSREGERGEGSLARGLQHDGAARRDRGCELVRDEVEGKIEGADRPDHTDRHSQGEGELAVAGRAGVHRYDLSGERSRRDRRERERGDGALRLDAGGLDRLRGLGRDHPGEVLGALREQLRGAIEDLGALPGGQRSGVQHGLRGPHRRVDLLRSARGDAPQQLAVVRRAYLDPFARHDRRVADRNGPVS